MFWHWHKWKVTGAQQLDRCLRSVAYGEMHSMITEVLMVCDCGAVCTKELDGHWELDQLRPKPNEKEADKEFFRKMGVKL